MSTVAQIDHVALGQSRVLSQYFDSPNFLAYLQAYLDLSNNLEQCFQDMQYLADIDRMSGTNLDVIGIIVGASRFVGFVVTLTWFGFDDTGYYATPFGELSDPSIGSRFYEEHEVISSTTLVEDPEYRLIIKAKIVKNNGSSVPEDIIAGLRFIFGTEDIRLIEDLVANPMAFSISIGRPVMAFEQALINTLDILPRPAGVRIIGPVTSYVPPSPDYEGGIVIEGGD